MNELNNFNLITGVGKLWENFCSFSNPSTKDYMVETKFGKDIITIPIECFLSRIF